MAIEIPSIFGYVDSSAYLDGEPADAAQRQFAIRHGNRLIARQQDLLDQHQIPCSDDAADQEVEGVARGYGSLGWQLIRGPRVVAKKPGLTRAEVRIMMRLLVPFTGAVPGRRFWMQIVTEAQPFRSDDLLASGLNIIQMTPTDTSVTEYSKTGIPVQWREGERLWYFIRGGITDVAMDAAFGTQTGTVAAPPTISAFDDGKRVFGTATGWTASIATAGHYITFSGLNTIHQIAQRASATELRIRPSANVPLEGRTFNIYQLGRWNLASIALYPEDRNT